MLWWARLRVATPGSLPVWKQPATPDGSQLVNTLHLPLSLYLFARWGSVHAHLYSSARQRAHLHGIDAVACTWRQASDTSAQLVVRGVLRKRFVAKVHLDAAAWVAKVCVGAVRPWLNGVLRLIYRILVLSLDVVCAHYITVELWARAVWVVAGMPLHDHGVSND